VQEGKIVALQELEYKVSSLKDLINRMETLCKESSEFTSSLLFQRVRLLT